MDKKELAAIKFDSIQHEILPIEDDVIVYNAHGPGSSCGKNLGPGTQTTIGEERRSNYALQLQTKEEFMKAVTTGLGEHTQYFSINAKIN